ncbi:hypothetical protein EY643_09330 [Halioglobus maricola]|uniref:Uracil-DNA glycosylase-like domain-containing protein n=1 Tax=Halioglobus maricola TaxID=2601894 RepID=A0A5P9NKT1_9GAMM|nr:uracil-DNA glycosylase [Halioglobus maricola]QFU75844.1 hypothetical protein EY643_09330 [Halioglobus maricola]
MEFISHYIATLAACPPSDIIANPYADERLCNNLRVYLQKVFNQPGRRVLLVGEALGYRGGVHTGIPFSSARLARQSRHPFWRDLRKELQIESDVSEATASIVWDYLAARRRIPLCWNGLPFHPHLPSSVASNRAPTAADLRLGEDFLRQLVSAYRPDRIAAVGGKAAVALERALPGQTFYAIRHPSYGGKQDFIRGMDRLLR